MAESRKTLLAIICDILFPCADYAISEAKEKPRTDLLSQKKQTTTTKKQWEHDGSKSASKIEVMVRSCSEKQFEKKKGTFHSTKYSGLKFRVFHACDEWNSIFRFVGLPNPRSSVSKFRARIQDQTDGSFTFIFLLWGCSTTLKLK